MASGRPKTTRTRARRRRDAAAARDAEYVIYLSSFSKTIARRCAWAGWFAPRTI